MKVDLKALGSLQADAEKARVDFVQAVWTATQQTGFDLLEAQRADVIASRIRRAPAMAKTWRQVMRPATARDSGDLRIAAIVFNRSPVFARYLARSGPISARGGALLIPIGKAARIRLPIGRSRRELLAFARRQFGEIVLGRLRNGTPALGAVTRTPRGKAKFEPLFLLRKSVTARARLKPVTIYRAFLRTAPDRWFQRVLASFNAAQGSDFRVASVETNADRRDARGPAGLAGFSVSAGLNRGLGGR